MKSTLALEKWRFSTCNNKDVEAEEGVNVYLCRRADGHHSRQELCDPSAARHHERLQEMQRRRRRLVLWTAEPCPVRGARQPPWTPSAHPHHTSIWYPSADSDKGK